MILKYTNINRIYAMANRIKPNGFVEADIINWVGEALDFMETPKQLVESVCYTEVSNHQVTIPNWTQNIIQIVRDNNFTVGTSTGLCASNVITDSEVSTDEEGLPLPACQFFPEGEGNPVVVNQLGEPITDYELAYYRPFFDLEYDYLSWAGSSLYRSRFSPVRLTNNSFFNSIVCPEQSEIYCSCEDEYSIIEGEILRFSFETGGVIISYLKQKTENGIPMIPDDISCIKAIENYIRLQYETDEFYSGRQGSDTRMAKAEADWHWYCGQFTSKMKMPSSVDEWQNLLEGRGYLIPRNHYYGYFGHANKAERRDYLKS